MPETENKNGLLIVDKPLGESSFDVVRDVRRLAQTRKVGHTGTLDPEATGVLALALGRCTKLSKYLMLDNKKYTFTMKLGEATNTDDTEGEVVTRADWEHIERGDIEAVLDQFVGNIEQVPPVYSAIKIDGKRAYARARDGEDVELEARSIEVHSLEIVEWRPPFVDLVVRCGPGTYVRSLSRDIAKAVDSVAHTTAIRRLAVGPFTIESAVDFEALTKENFWDHAAAPMTMVQTLSRYEIGEEYFEYLSNGRPLEVKGDWELDEAVAGHDEQGNLIAVLECTRTNPGRAQLWPRRVMI